jgi:uncharacterized protein YktB (UPF0637 family)
MAMGKNWYQSFRYRSAADYTDFTDRAAGPDVQIIMQLFTAQDLKVFDIQRFNERMAAILARIRPKLTSIGEELAPKVRELVDVPLFVHVAKHARRTVNPPDDTWAALGANARGYKKDVHFKVAVSRHCVRFLFEVGPEYYAKADWAKEWHHEFKAIADALKGNKGLEWFKNEHDEDPNAVVSALTPAELKKLADELVRRKDGQLVLGRRLDASVFVELKPKQVEKIAIETFTPLAPLFEIHAARVLN